MWFGLAQMGAGGGGRFGRKSASSPCAGIAIEPMPRSRVAVRGLIAQRATKATSSATNRTIARRKTVRISAQTRLPINAPATPIEKVAGAQGAALAELREVEKGDLRHEHRGEEAWSPPARRQSRHEQRDAAPPFARGSPGTDRNQEAGERRTREQGEVGMPRRERQGFVRVAQPHVLRKQVHGDAARHHEREEHEERRRSGGEPHSDLNLLDVCKFL